MTWLLLALALGVVAGYVAGRIHAGLRRSPIVARIAGEESWHVAGRSRTRDAIARIRKAYLRNELTVEEFETMTAEQMRKLPR